jgi:hypothetical protein
MSPRPSCNRHKRLLCIKKLFCMIPIWVGGVETGTGDPNGHAVTVGSALEGCREVNPPCSGARTEGSAFGVTFPLRANQRRSAIHPLLPISARYTMDCSRPEAVTRCRQRLRGEMPHSSRLRWQRAVAELVASPLSFLTYPAWDAEKAVMFLDIAVTRRAVRSAARQHEHGLRSDATLSGRFT